MALTVSLRNTMVDAATEEVSEVSLHDGDPGEEGDNELSGSGYSRQSVSFDDASGGSAPADDDIVFDVPGDGTEVTHVGVWTDDGTFLAGGSTTEESFSNPGTYTLTELTLSVNNPSS
ncbi:phage tail fiber protein [Nocardiopsis oceani]